jgi:hypothetical protein
MLISRALRSQRWKLPIRRKQRYLQSNERHWKRTDGYAELRELGSDGKKLSVGRWIWKVNSLLFFFI